MDHFRPDPFLSEALERSAYMLAAPPSIGQVDSFCAEYAEVSAEAGFFASAKVSVDAPEEAHILEEVGFRLIDTNMVFDRDAVPFATAYAAEIRTAQAQDEEQVRRIAATSLVSSRFHLDPVVPDEKAARIKADWAGNYFHGRRGDDMLVAELDGRLLGFLLLLHLRECLVIDLIAVDGAVRRGGVASALISHALRHSGGYEKMIVGTQAANVVAARFYEALGFRFAGAKYVFHAHGGSGADR